MSNTGTFFEKTKSVCDKVGSVIGSICSWIYKLRKLIMAAPVVYLAIRIAIANSNRLPEAVGMNLQSSGEFAMMVTRNYAVFGPLLVTGFCLLLMFCSMRACGVTPRRFASSSCVNPLFLRHSAKRFPKFSIYILLS